MNTSTVILNTATILRAIGRASLAVAWLFAHHQTTTASDRAPVGPSAEPAVYAEAAPSANAGARSVDAGAYSVVAPLAARSECARGSAPVRYIDQPPVDAPAAQAVQAEPATPAPRSKCGDLPRAPWNTCVALHDHEI
jgi:hypothetical protein